MPDPITAIVAGGTIITGTISANAQRKAGEAAAGAELEASKAGIAENRRQFDALQKILAPYNQAGVQALERKSALAGLSGPEAQAALIKEIEASPLFTSTVEQGESAILASASATGGLRGGNVQGALAQFRPAVLNEIIAGEHSRLGELINVGQSSAAGVGAAGLRTGVNISNLTTQGGAAVAGGHIARGNATVQQMQAIDNAIGIIAVNAAKEKGF